jgi:hypothetical protein
VSSKGVASAGGDAWRACGSEGSIRKPFVVRTAQPGPREERGRAGGARRPGCRCDLRGDNPDPRRIPATAPNGALTQGTRCPWAGGWTGPGQELSFHRLLGQIFVKSKLFTLNSLIIIYQCGQSDRKGSSNATDAPAHIHEGSASPCGHFCALPSLGISTDSILQDCAEPACNRFL